jgi:hypothetical protein
MPSYTAQVGHWAESLVHEVAARVPADVDRDRVLAALRDAGARIEMLTGQSFGPPARNSVSIATFGLPFVELPGLLIGSEESSAGIWPIPNPVDRDRATIVQVAEVVLPTEPAMPVAGALRVAGDLVHAAARSGFLSRDFVLSWLGHSFRPEDRTAFLRDLLDASNHVHVPVAWAARGGWWLQITRRITWITQATEEQRLVEPLFPDGDGALRALVAIEPLLIVSRITSNPAYSAAVERIARATGAPGKRAAAALLFEGLLRPGFDPAMGAAAARRYVSRKATIAILNHRKASDGSVRPWEALGVSERRYYKLLQRFAPKIGARYQVDEGVLEQIRTHLASRDQEADKHAAAMDLLQERGFSYAAARKWLQRHDLSEAVTAMPRCRQPPARPAF